MKFSLAKNKNLIFIISGIVVGFILLFYGSVSDKKETPQNNQSQNNYSSPELQTYTAYLENRIEDLLNQINGVSNAKVMVTIESSKETIYAKEGANLDYVIIRDSSGNENALPVKEISANIRGVAIVCDYQNNDSIKIKIIELISSLFGIGSNRISIMNSK